LKSSGNIANLFFTAAQKHPQRTAIIHKGTEITFELLEKQVGATASYFLSKGIVKGDRVLVFVPMSIDLYRIVLALFSIGATAVFLDEWVSKKRMEECCKVAQCKGFIGIFKARVLSWFSSELRKIPVNLGTSCPGNSFDPEKKWREDVMATDTALITFTTGSTGTPKAAKRTHDFLFKQFAALNDKLEPKENDIDMPVLPIVLFMNLGNGTTSLIIDFKASKPESIKPSAIISQMLGYRVNRMIASPFFVKAISDYIIKNKIHLPEMKKVFTGGAPVFPGEAEVYQQAFPGANIEVVYGSTEAEPISSINVKELIPEKEKMLRHGLKVGPVYSGAHVKIIRITDEPVIVSNEEELEKLSPGVIGEIIVSGAHVLSEYFNNEEAIRRNKIFINGRCWHRTGDSGYVDEAGMLFLTGRCNAIIHAGEIFIASFLYENYLYSLPGVNAGTIVKLNEGIICVIELNDKTKRQSVVKAIEMLALKFDEIKFIPKIPRDLRHNSKIDYILLRKLLGKV
jgi:olefin beta-lactone synthetase